MAARIAFLASHLLSPSVASGGDVLFCELASRIAVLRPDWEIVAVAPKFAEQALSRYFHRVVTFQTSGTAQQGSPLSVGMSWVGRLRAASQSLASVQPDLIHCTGDFFIDTLPAYRHSLRTGSRWSGVVHHINAPPHQRQNAFSVAAISYLLQRVALHALRRADSISVLNHDVLQQLKQLDFRPERIHVVGAGIDIERFPLKDGTKRERRALWINRLEPTKGLFDLPAILKSLPLDVQIDVVGKGPEVHVSRLRRMLGEAGVSERCMLHGFVCDEQLRVLMERAGVFISCSYEEGWGISIAEALATGTPCITYDLPSHREIFGDSIERVPTGNTTMFGAVIEAALDSPYSLAAAQMRRSAASRHSLDACARRQERVFAELFV